MILTSIKVELYSPLLLPSSCIRWRPSSSKIDRSIYVVLPSRSILFLFCVSLSSSQPLPSEGAA